MLAIRGEKGAPRFAYLDGALEIMTFSKSHEGIKSAIGRLVEAYCLERGIRFSPFGGWTQEDQSEESGAEPDECYLFGGEEADRPHLVIEVVWTSGGLNKLEIYRRLAKSAKTPSGRCSRSSAAGGRQRARALQRRSNRRRDHTGDIPCSSNSSLAEIRAIRIEGARLR